MEEHKEEHRQEEPEEIKPLEPEDSEDEGQANVEEDVNDDLLGAAFGAKERTKHGDFLADEHPLERRANEAKQNDCKVLLLSLKLCAHGDDAFRLCPHSPARPCEQRRGAA